MKILIQAAMGEEIEPLLQAATATPLWKFGCAQAWDTKLGGHEVTLVRSGIGLVNAAIATTTALHHTTTYISESDTPAPLDPSSAPLQQDTTNSPDLILAVGTCGGLGSSVKVGSQIIGSSYVYNGADATLFGYELGQIPQMPARYAGADQVLTAARKLQREQAETSTIQIGEVISGDSFIEHTSVARIRELFPAAIATDMESCAIAQTAAAATIPFASIRTVSDMCNWTESEAQAADNEFISLQQQPHSTAATATTETRREHVYRLAAEQLLELLSQL